MKPKYKNFNHKKSNKSLTFGPVIHHCNKLKKTIEQTWQTGNVNEAKKMKDLRTK